MTLLSGPAIGPSRRAALVLRLGLAVLVAAAARPAAARKPGAKTGVVGAIRGTVVLRGKVKRAKRIFNPYAEVYGGVGNGADVEPAGHVVVYLEAVPGAWPAPADHAVLDQRNRHFTTDVLPVLVGTTVDFTNHDSIFHNVFSVSEPNKFDLGRRARNETQSRAFVKLPPAGIGVTKLFCEIHANMHAVILVMRNPFWAVVPESGGAFEMTDVPAGTYRLAGWHGSWTADPVSVTVTAGQTATVTLPFKVGP